MTKKSNYTLVQTKHFQRSLRKFLRARPQLQTRVTEVLNRLIENPFSPPLKLHPLSGPLEGVQAVSVTYEYRIILTVMITNREVVLLDIGTHDDVYR